MKESAVRTRILDVASRLFYQQGYNLTGINQIIEEAEIARGSLYNHFDSKTDLLIAYLNEAEEVWFREMEDFVAPISGPREKLLALFDYRIARQVKLSYGGCQFLKICSEVSREDHQIFEIVGNQKSRFKAYISDLVKDLHDREASTLDPDLLSNTLFLLIEGASAVGGVYKNSECMENAKEAAKKLI